jgi:lysozyme
MSAINPAVARVAAVLAAVAIAVPLIGKWEGVQPVGYPDVGGIPTDCAGHTEGAVIGRRYTLEQCMQYLAGDAVQKGMAIDGCIGVPVPAESRAAFTSFAFNEGSGAFCSSGIVSHLNAGDLAGACRQLNTGDDGRPQWIYVRSGVLPNGKPRYVVVPGLVARRAEERAFCERGLAKPAIPNPPA